MNRRLVMVRHAKAAAGSPDRQRALAARGRRDSTEIGRWLAEAGIVPDRVVCSPSVRARETWELAAGRVGGLRVEPVLDERLYDNELDATLDVLRETPADTGTLVLVGHNPSTHEVALELDDGTGDEHARHELGRGYPTAGVAVFSIGAPWAEIDEGAGFLEAFVVPR